MPIGLTPYHWFKKEIIENSLGEIDEDLSHEINTYSLQHRPPIFYRKLGQIVLKSPELKNFTAKRNQLREIYEHILSLPFKNANPHDFYEGRHIWLDVEVGRYKYFQGKNLVDSGKLRDRIEIGHSLNNRSFS